MKYSVVAKIQSLKEKSFTKFVYKPLVDSKVRKKLILTTFLASVLIAFFEEQISTISPGAQALFYILFHYFILFWGMFFKCFQLIKVC
jgi:hypothetical protein